MKPRQLFIPSRSSLLCRLCRQIYNIAWSSQTTTIEHHSYLELKISASRGCSVCQYLFEAVAAPTDECVRIRREVSSRIPSTESSLSQRSLRVTHCADTIVILDYGSRSSNFEIFGLKDTSRSHFRQIAPSSTSVRAMDLAKDWINTCSQDHTACMRPDSERVFPTWVIDLNPDPPRLVDAKSVPSKKVPFVTLSHCWGVDAAMSHLLVMTTARRIYYRQGFDVAALPKTFRDAIELCQHLDIQYLWIDALCIRQDDSEHWQAEAAKMGLYYRDAYFTISALGASSGTEGFLRPRPPQRTVELGNNLHLRAACPSWSEVFRQSPLSQRAWVLQERLMSTRVLHFGENEMFWECLTYSAREGSNVKYTLQGQGTQWEDENFKRSLLFDTTDSEHIMETWYNVVSQYASLAITYQSDRFPALSGIAAAFQQATYFQYVAGLWLQHAHSGLLWLRQDLERTDKRTVVGDDDWVAPSWSWASLKGQITMLFDRKSRPIENGMMADIIDMKQESPTSEPFSRITSASLTVHAVCKEVWYQGSSGPCPFNDPVLSLVLSIYSSEGIMIGTGYRDFLDDGAPDDLKGCLAVVISEREDDPYGTEPITYFLLVRPLEHESKKEQDVYLRVGVGQTADPYYGETLRSNIFSELPKRTITIL